LCAVETATRSFIVKQSRGYVEKYPQVLAPASRVLTEGAFIKKLRWPILYSKSCRSF
jgi:5-methylthioribose kinase